MKPTVMMKHVFLKIHFSRKYQKMNALHKIFLRLRWYFFWLILNLSTQIYRSKRLRHFKHEYFSPTIYAMTSGKNKTSLINKHIHKYIYNRLIPCLHVRYQELVPKMVHQILCEKSNYLLIVIYFGLEHIYLVQWATDKLFFLWPIPIEADKFNFLIGRYR